MDLEDEIMIPLPTELASWLDAEYVQTNGFYATYENDLKKIPYGKLFISTDFGKIPLRSQSEIRIGDIIIFDNSIKELYGRYVATGIEVVDENIINDYHTHTLPRGVIVHPPTYH